MAQIYSLSFSDFLQAMLVTPTDPAVAAYDELVRLKTVVFEHNLQIAMDEEVDERFVLLYAQCALYKYEKGTLQ